jgi:molybdate transport system substrate-binding protein
VTDPASGGVAGVYIADVFKRLGIAEELRPKLKLTRGQRNAEFVAKGEVEIAIQLSNEIRIVPGVEFIPLPAEFARTFVFSAGLGSKTKEIDASKAVLQFLSGPEAITVTGSKGPHSITSSARASRVAGITRPSALAVLRLMMSS